MLIKASLELIEMMKESIQPSPMKYLNDIN